MDGQKVSPLHKSPSPYTQHRVHRPLHGPASGNNNNSISNNSNCNNFPDLGFKQIFGHFENVGQIQAIFFSWLAWDESVMNNTSGTIIHNILKNS